MGHHGRADARGVVFGGLVVADADETTLLERGVLVVGFVLDGVVQGLVTASILRLLLALSLLA